MTGIEKIKYWIRLAQDNLESAKILFDHGKFLDSGFYCHQVIEKSLKAAYWSIKGSEPPFTHNLLKLTELSGLLSKMSEEQTQLISQLMPLNIAGRYPDEKDQMSRDFQKKDISEIISSTEALKKWISRFLKK